MAEDKISRLVVLLSERIAENKRALAAEEEAMKTLATLREERFRASTAVLNADQALDAAINEATGRFAK